MSSGKKFVPYFKTKRCKVCSRFFKTKAKGIHGCKGHQSLEEVVLKDEL